VEIDPEFPDAIFRSDFEQAPPPPDNDVCATADVLFFGPTFTGTTVGAGSDYDSGLETEACTGYSQGGADVVYQVLLPAASTKYTVTLSNLDSWFDASVSLVGPGMANVCSSVPLNCLAGADVGSFGEGETLEYTTSSAGYYYVIVDSFYVTPYSGGMFTIQIHY
jgi:hypothetical protein